MAASNFFSVERTGYTKLSDLFVDVMRDMTTHGFTLINSSNEYPLKSWVASVNDSDASFSTGDKLYINSGVRPTHYGVPRPAPYVTVTSVTSTNEISGISPVQSTYDYPLWTTPPESPLILSANVRMSNGSYRTGNANVSLTLNTVTRLDMGTITRVPPVVNAPEQYSFVLESTGLVDPLSVIDPNDSSDATESKRQPWRIQFVISDAQKVSGSVATKLQMAYDEVTGRVNISQITDDTGTIVDNVGGIGAQQPGGIFSDTDLNQGFYNRKIRVANTPQTYPLTYILSITDRGVFLGIYEGTWSTTRAKTTNASNYFNWVLIQRPVDRNTGQILVRGKAPVFHINSVNYKYYKAVVRESDILHPTSGPVPTLGQGFITLTNGATPDTWKITGITDPTTGLQPQFIRDIEVGSTIYDATGAIIGQVKTISGDTSVLLSTKPAMASFSGGQTYYFTPPNVQSYRTLADVHSPDSHAIFNSVNQVALTEDKKYLLTFPHNLTTPRFRYTEELDMIGITSADVVMSGQDIQFKTYGETGPRTYRALPASGALNTGMRLAVLWAPQGPSWDTPDEGYIGPDIEPGTLINITLRASPVPVSSGGAANASPTYSLVSGILPSGITLDPSGILSGTVQAMDYAEPSNIKFTISAKNVENSGYALRDFHFVYKPTTSV